MSFALLKREFVELRVKHRKEIDKLNEKHANERKKAKIKMQEACSHEEEGRSKVIDPQTTKAIGWKCSMCDKFMQV